MKSTLFRKLCGLPCIIKESVTLLISGIICISLFWILSFNPNINYVDEAGLLHEPFFLLGGGWLFIGIGMILLVLSGIFWLLIQFSKNK